MKGYKNIIIFFLILILYSIVELPFIDRIPKIWVDEVWYGGTAYNFSQGKGFTNQNVVGLYGGDYLFGYPLFLGTFYKIFNTSMLTSKLFSFFLGILFIIFFYFLFSKILNFDLKQKIIFFIFFIFSSTVYIVYRTVRPECLKIFFSMLSLYFFLKGIKEKNYYFVFSFLFSFCGVLTHPDEIFFTIIFFFIVSFHSFKKNDIKPFLFSSLTLIVCFSFFLFFIWFVKHSSVQEFYFLYSRRLSIKEYSLLGDPFQKLKNLYGDYAFGLKRLYIFLFEILIFPVSFLIFKKDKDIKILSFIGFSYFILGLLFMERFVTRGFISIIFYSILVLTLILKKSDKKKKKLLIFLSSLYFLNNLLSISYFIYINRNITSYGLIEKYINERSKNANVVISNVIFYFPLKDKIFFNDYTYYKLTKYKTLDSLLKSQDMDLIIISDYFLTGVKSVSMRKEEKEVVNKFKIFYGKLDESLKKNFLLFDTLKTDGYGTIKFYKNID